MKNKQGEYSALVGIKNDLEVRVAELEGWLDNSKNSQNQLQAEKTKNLKMI